MSKDNEMLDIGIQDDPSNGKLVSATPYYVVYKHLNEPGTWSNIQVDIMQKNTKSGDKDTCIGSYIRRYSMLRTFLPFELRGKWYALYSKDYTCTRIMSLPDCEDIGGEEPDTFGFCPIDYFVPCLNYFVRRKDPKDPKGYTYDSLFAERIHGFVAGCIWGDDSSMKIQYLDLSQADKGIIKRDDRFGYIALPDNLNLDKAIELEIDDDPVNEPYLNIAIKQQFKITGEKIWD